MKYYFITGITEKGREFSFVAKVRDDITASEAFSIATKAFAKEQEHDDSFIFTKFERVE